MTNVTTNEATIRPVMQMGAYELVEGHILGISPVKEYKPGKTMAQVRFIQTGSERPELLAVYGGTIPYVQEAEGAEVWVELRHQDSGKKMITQVVNF